MVMFLTKSVGNQKEMSCIICINLNKTCFINSGLRFNDILPFILDLLASL